MNIRSTKKYITVLENDNLSQNAFRVAKQKKIFIKAQFIKNNIVHIVKVEIVSPSLPNGDITALNINKITVTIKPIKVIGHKEETFSFLIVINTRNQLDPCGVHRHNDSPRGASLQIRGLVKPEP